MSGAGPSKPTAKKQVEKQSQLGLYQFVVPRGVESGGSEAYMPFLCQSLPANTAQAKFFGGDKYKNR